MPIPSLTLVQTTRGAMQVPGLQLVGGPAAAVVVPPVPPVVPSIDTGTFDYWSRGEVYPAAGTVTAPTFDYWSRGELLPEVA